jgi:predicted amidophosphoribosyltransferase
MVTLPLMKCPSCQYEWVARTADPKRCPNCFKKVKQHAEPETASV